MYTHPVSWGADTGPSHMGPVGLLLCHHLAPTVNFDKQSEITNFQILKLT